MGSVIIQAVIAALTWFVSGVALRAVIVGAVYWLLTYLAPMIWGYVVPFAGVSSLTSLFESIPDGVYWGLYAIKGDVGFPLLISAYVARFLIRRLPIVG